MTDQEYADDAEIAALARFLHDWDIYPERRRPEYCWRSIPPHHTEDCGCDIPAREKTWKEWNNFMRGRVPFHSDADPRDR